MEQNQRKSAQELQDEHFRNLSAEEKIRLTTTFSEFLLELNQLDHDRRIPGTSRRSR
jgi:hypothetical protein